MLQQAQPAHLPTAEPLDLSSEASVALRPCGKELFLHGAKAYEVRLHILRLENRVKTIEKRLKTIKND